MTQDQVAALPQSERMHFMRCPKCGEYFDCRDFDSITFHNLGHGAQRPPRAPAAAPELVNMLRRLRRSSGQSGLTRSPI